MMAQYTPAGTIHTHYHDVEANKKKANGTERKYALLGSKGLKSSLRHFARQYVVFVIPNVNFF